MAKKVIAVQEGLHRVADYLKDAGYQITSIDDGSVPIDVIVYSSENKEYLANNTTGKIGIAANNKFVKMINVDEIDKENIIPTIEELN